MTREFLKQPIPFPGHKHCFKDGYLTNVRPVRDNELSQETMRHIFMRYIFSFLAECEHEFGLRSHWQLSYRRQGRDFWEGNPHGGSRASGGWSEDGERDRVKERRDTVA